MPSARDKTRDFLENETAFRLGALPTEQSHPKTRELSTTATTDPRAGVRMLLSVDRDIPPVARRVMSSPEWAHLVDTLARALRAGKRITFTGCGATGRLSILLETAWRHFWQSAPRSEAHMEDRLRSVMAGGDFALVKSVEGFEDFPAFGRHQLRESGVGPGEVVVAITEGGETPFVIGTAWEALDAGAEVFFVFNNPTEALARHVVRSREVIDEPRITKLCLATGPMAVAGSTRMQATTIELLVVGAALEAALHAARGESPPPPGAWVDAFESLLDAFDSDAGVDALAGAVLLEEEVYRNGGLVTYFARDLVMDIFTDTTERSPTFSLPPFRREGDDAFPPSWAFVKDPSRSTETAWRAALGREPRCLEWTAKTYEALGAPAGLRAAPPALGRAELMRFRIGDEADSSRCRSGFDAAVAVRVGEGDAFAPAGFPRRAALVVGGGASTPTDADVVFCVPAVVEDSLLRLGSHLAVKLALNTISTATMARMGRVDGNWMVWVSPTNKKLIDRGTRLIADRAGMPYDAACEALFDAVEAISEWPAERRAGVSPVAFALEKRRS